MGAVVACQSSFVAIDEETKKKRIKRKKLLVAVQKNRLLMSDSWRLIILLKHVKGDDSIVPGLTAFCQEFKRINDSYGELRLNLQSCKNTEAGSPDLMCIHILKHVMAVKIESTGSINSIRALGRHHAIVGKQDRLWQLFDVLLQTLSARLGTAGEGSIMGAWRVHFDTIHKAMMTDTIRLYPELHSLRVSSCSSKHGSVSDGDGGVSDDEGSASPKQRIALSGSLDSTKAYASPVDLPKFASFNDEFLCVQQEAPVVNDLDAFISRVNSTKVEHGSVKEGGGAAVDEDEDEEGNTRQTFAHITFRTALDDNKDYAHSADLPRFAIADIHNRDCEILSVAAARDGAPLATCGPFALEDHAAHEDNTSAEQEASSPRYQTGKNSENEGTVLL